MENNGSIPEILLLVALLSAGAILFLATRKVIEQWAIFRGARAAVAAFSMTCLVVASLALSLVIPENNSANSGSPEPSVNFALLPGVAVAGTIILLQLFMIAGATTPIKAGDVAVKEIVPKSPQSKSPAKPAQKSKTHPKPSKAAAKSPTETVKKTENRS